MTDATLAPNLSKVAPTLGDDTLVDAETACAALGGVSRMTLWRMTQRRELTLYKVGTCARYAIGDLRRIVQASRQVTA